MAVPPRVSYLRMLLPALPTRRMARPLTPLSEGLPPTLALLPQQLRLLNSPLSMSTNNQLHHYAPSPGAQQYQNQTNNSAGTGGSPQAPPPSQSRPPASSGPAASTTAPSPGRRTTGSAAAAAAAAVVTAAEARLADPKRKHATNLYVDIAETCLEIFPYAEVARRHAVSRQRVADVFAAIIQLPLLRCPTDKRRVGKLGIARMKEYNKGRKDVAQKKADDRAAGHGQQPQQQGGDKETTAPSTPSIYEVAQSMGPMELPADVLRGGGGFRGPW